MQVLRERCNAKAWFRTAARSRRSVRRPCSARWEFPRRPVYWAPDRAFHISAVHRASRRPARIGPGGTRDSVATGACGVQSPRTCAGRVPRCVTLSGGRPETGEARRLQQTDASVAHEQKEIASRQQAAGDPAEQPLSDPAVPVTTRDDQIRAESRGFGAQDLDRAEIAAL
jgi:hypothetical protein